jgi:hypothetical protein
MTKQVEFFWPEIEVKVSATLLEEDEPELCATLWSYLETPKKLICRHTLSTGCNFGCEGRPPRDPVKSGTQAQPLGRKHQLLTRVKPGSVSYAIFGGYGGVGLFYGPCTEPLPTRGAIVGNVNEEDMNELVRAGKAVWNSQYMTHRPMVMIARRRDR